MKKKISKDLILFVLILPVFLFLAFYISNRMEKSHPLYSILNKSKMGYSIFYEALKKLNYPVEKALKPVNDYKESSVQIITPGGNFNINSLEVKEWVEKGGILVYLTPETNSSIDYATLGKSSGDIKNYKYHKGSIINVKELVLTNKNLIKDTSAAYELLIAIDDLSYEKLYFNESYLALGPTNKTVWDTIPIQIKYIIYQLLIALTAFFYYKGKRFGKIIPLYEEVERSENEYLYSAASLYRQAKCYDLMVDNYYKNFLKGFAGNKNDWLEYWEKEKIPSLNQARKVYEFMNYKKTKPSAKEYIQIVSMLEHLNKILDNRSDKHWKTLKKISQEKS